MTRGLTSSIGRPLTVWVLVSVAVVGSWTGVSDAATSLVLTTTPERAWTGTFEQLLVGVASAAFVACSCWLWVITTLTVVDLLVGRPCSTHGLARRVVLMACGVAVVAGVSGPAHATGGADDPVLAGLPLPDRAVASAAQRPAQQPRPVTAPGPPVRRTPSAATTLGEAITVQPGDSLWSIAQADLGPGAGLHEIDERWRAIYAANRDEIGNDPDLVTPGQELRRPRPESHQ